MGKHSLGEGTMICFFTDQCHYFFFYKNLFSIFFYFLADLWIKKNAVWADKCPQIVHSVISFQFSCSAVG